MGHTASVYALTGRETGGFGGGLVSSRLNGSPKPHTVPRPDLCHDDSIQRGGLDVRVYRIMRGDTDIGPLWVGCGFEVTVGALSGQNNDSSSHGLCVGVGPAAIEGAPENSVLWGKLWAHGSTGNFWDKGSRVRSKKAFKTGDTISCTYSGDGCFTFRVNGSVAGSISDVTGVIYPVVCLRPGDVITGVRLVGTAPLILPVASNIWDLANSWSQSNPLHPIFKENDMRQSIPDAPVLPTDLPQDLSPYLLEKHLWGPGLPVDVLDRESAKLSGCMYTFLRHRIECEDIIRCNAEARASRPRAVAGQPMFRVGASP